MTQSSGERKKPVLQLKELVPIGKRAKGQAKHDQHAQSELECVPKPRPENRLGIKAVCPQQINKVCQREVKVNMLQAEQNCKDDTAVEEGRSLACQNNGQDQEAVHKSIVLEVDVVDNEEPGG